MAALAQRTRAQFLPSSDPNVIPFIDVLLVLLIIFMVTAPKPTTDLRVDLPRPGPAAPVVILPTMIEIRSAPGGYRVLVGGQEAGIDQLGQRTLEHVISANPALTPEAAFADARVFVRADLDVAYQNVISVVETLQQSRFQQVAIVAQDADAP